MKTPNQASIASSPHALRVAIAIIATAAAVLFSGCASMNPFAKSPPPPPPVVVAAEPAPGPPPALRFSAVGEVPIADRSSVVAQRAVSESNRIWTVRSTEKAAYLRNARLLNAALEAEEFTTREEQIRLATMSLQNALLADDRDALRVAARHWEAGFNGIRSAPNAGEVETFVLTCRRLGQEPPESLMKITHPEIEAILGLNQ